MAVSRLGGGAGGLCSQAGSKETHAAFLVCAPCTATTVCSCQQSSLQAELQLCVQAWVQKVGLVTSSVHGCAAGLWAVHCVCHVGGVRTCLTVARPMCALWANPLVPALGLVDGVDEAECWKSVSSHSNGCRCAHAEQLSTLQHVVVHSTNPLEEAEPLQQQQQQLQQQYDTVRVCVGGGGGGYALPDSIGGGGGGSR
jgi:hypothetical protein